MDTLDLSGFNSGNFINLHAGSFSSVGQAIPLSAKSTLPAPRLASSSGYAPPVDAEGSRWDGALHAAGHQQAIENETGASGDNATEHDNLGIAYGTVIENATGGSARDVIWGNEVANVLKGLAGDDVLNGFEGADTLWGGSGKDTFQFAHLERGDTIQDFAKGDLIDLSNIDADSGRNGDQAFKFVGSAAFTKTAGELRFDGTTVYGDVNGDGVADFTVIIANGATLSGSDFLF